MRSFLLGAPIRMAGGDPVRVLALARALRREADGQRSWQHAQEGGGWLGPTQERWLTHSVLFLISISVATLIRAALAEGLWLAGAILCLAQAGGVALTMARDAVPLLLSDEDRCVIGWWPVSERELLLARCCLLLRRMLQATVAVVALPWMVLTAHAPLPLLNGAGALVGLALHTAALLLLLALGIRGLARLVGLQGARRSAELLGLLALIALMGQAGTDVLRGYFLSLGEFSSSWRMLAVPFFWFGAWAVLWPLSWPVLAAALLAAAAGGLVATFGLRILGSGKRGEFEPAPARSRRGDVRALPIMAVLAPLFKGREGRILLLLCRAHLRRDWRLVSQLTFLPLLYLAMTWRHLSQLTAAESSGLALGAGAITTVLFLTMLLGLFLGSTITFTGEPSAAWILRSGVIDGRRMLVLHRRLLRFLVAVPFVAGVLIMLQARAGLPLQVLAATTSAALLAFEMSVALAQWLRPALPFSRAWRRHEYGGWGHGILVLAVMAPLLLLWGRLVLERSMGGWMLTVAMQLLLLLAALELLKRRVARRGLYGMKPGR